MVETRSRRLPAVEPLLLGYRAAAEVLGGIGYQMVAKLVDAGHLEGRRLGRRCWVTTASVKNLAETGAPVILAKRSEKHRTPRPEGWKPKPKNTAAAHAARRARGRAPKELLRCDAPAGE